MPCIKVRRISVKWKKTADLFRNLPVMAQRNSFERWKDSVGYGQRWIIETVFSSLKRMFEGEYVYSVKMENMKQDLMLNAFLYDKFMSIRDMLYDYL